MTPRIRSPTLPPDDAHDRTRGDGELRGWIHDVAVDHVEGRLPKLNGEAGDDLVVHGRQPGRPPPPDGRHGAEKLARPHRAGKDLEAAALGAGARCRAEAEPDLLDGARVHDR